MRLFLFTYQIFVPQLSAAALFMVSNNFYIYRAKFTKKLDMDAQALHEKVTKLENLNTWLLPIEFSIAKGESDLPVKYKLTSIIGKIEMSCYTKKTETYRSDTGLNYGVIYFV